jgi:hypothetical protein
MRTNQNKIEVVRIRIGGKIFYPIEQFMQMNSLTTRMSVYNWIKEGKAEKKKIGSGSFFTLK